MWTLSRGLETLKYLRVHSSTTDIDFTFHYQYIHVEDRKKNDYHFFSLMYIFHELKSGQSLINLFLSTL